MTTGPEPPSNVRFELPDGQVVPCEVFYDGYRAGIHQWVATVPFPLDAGARARIDTLPAHTSVSFQLTPEE